MNNNVIDLNEYRQRKKDEKINNKNSSKITDEDDRRDTFNLFMRVLATMIKESY